MGERTVILSGAICGIGIQLALWGAGVEFGTKDWWLLFAGGAGIVLSIVIVIQESAR